MIETVDFSCDDCAELDCSEFRHSVEVYGKGVRVRINKNYILPRIQQKLNEDGLVIVVDNDVDVAQWSTYKSDLSLANANKWREMISGLEQDEDGAYIKGMVSFGRQVPVEELSGDALFEIAASLDLLPRLINSAPDYVLR